VTKRGGKILNWNNLNDHQFTKKRSNKSADEWRCRIRSCNSIIVLACDASTVIHPSTDHSHTPDPIQAKVDEFKNICKNRAREETTRISQIHKEELVKCSLKYNDVSFLASYSTIDSSFYRVQLRNYPKLPKSVSDLTLTGKWSTDLRDNVFIINDLRERDTYLLVFGSKWGIEYLSEVDTWHTDDGYMIPTIYALTSDKRRKTYEQILRQLLNKQINMVLLLIQTGGLTSYLEVGDPICTESSINCLHSAIGLALIPLNILGKTWANIMPEYTSDDPAVTTFNDYLADTYVDDDAIFPSFIQLLLISREQIIISKIFTID
ncbi:unnamed protein product, partial [Didymodactylos carnosus]